jgi:hypothetical protein
VIYPPPHSWDSAQGRAKRANPETASDALSELCERLLRMDSLDEPIELAPEKIRSIRAATEQFWGPPKGTR